MRLRILKFLAPALVLGFLLSPAVAAPAAADAVAPATRAAAVLPAVTPHGILADRVVPLAHLEDLDGSPAAPAATASRWRQALHELGRAAEDPAAWPAAAAAKAAASPQARPRAAAKGMIALGLIHADYDRLDAQGQVMAAEVFAFAPLDERTYDGAALTFGLAPGFVVEKSAVAITALRLDAGDGLGWRALPRSGELRVSYDTTGPKTLRLQADLADGRTLHAAALLTVEALVTPDPTQTWAVTATVPYDGVFGSGQAYVYLSDQHAVLTNPVVVVEGFDLDNTMDWPVLYDLLNQENLLEDMRAEGFDAVVLDFTEATDPIQRNAFVLTELLARVRAETDPGRSMALIGASMGGLVSRYALLWMEQQAIDHRVRTWISFDSPQKGADIPLGLQYWLFFFRGESVDANLLLSRLDMPAARQMLLYHYTDPATTIPVADPLFPLFQDELATLGGWPAQPRKVAVVNGSGSRIDQGFGPGAQLIEYRYRSFLVDIDGDVWALPAGGPQVIFDGMLDKIWPLPDSYLNVAVENAAAWDGAPGGFRASLAQMDTTAVPYGDIIALYANHCFIPTISSLALDTQDPFYDVAGDPDLAALTPFDGFHFPAENQEHIAVTAQSKAWFLQEIELGVSATPDVPLALRQDPVLSPAYPNPFNPRTTVAFTLSRPARVDLLVYSLDGRVVRTLARGDDFQPGRHEVAWSGSDDRGRPAPTGVYVVRLKAGDVVRSGRVTLVK